MEMMMKEIEVKNIITKSNLPAREYSVRAAPAAKESIFITLTARTRSGMSTQNQSMASLACITVLESRMPISILPTRVLRLDSKKLPINRISVIKAANNSMPRFRPTVLLS